MILKVEDPIYYHEDLYRQIEFIPEENYFSSNRYISDLPKKEISDSGFINASDRKKHNEKSIKTASRFISFADFEKVVEPFAFNFFTNIITGYASYREKKENTVAWGFEVYGIFVEYDKSQIITNMWLCSSYHFSKDRIVRNLFNALNNIGLKYKLVLVDWNQFIVVRISNKNSLAKYLQDSFDFTVLY